MPVGFHQVPLDTAKAWAKRLAKSSKTLSPSSPWKLAQCQQVVAHMLGFDHWHALEQHLDAKPGQGTLPGVVEHAGAMAAADTLAPDTRTPDLPSQSPQALHLYRGTMPQDAEGWKELWQNALGIKGVGGIYLEKRTTDGLRARLRINGELVNYLEVPPDQAGPAIASLLPPAAARQLSKKDMTGYACGRSLLVDVASNGEPLRYQFLPVYPDGWDIVVQGPPSTRNATLADLGLPRGLADRLLGLCARPVGAFLFSGSVGTGRTTLMRAALREVIHQSPPAQPIKVASIGAMDVLPKGEPNISAIPMDKDQPGEFDRGVAGDLCIDVDRLVIGEIRDRETAKALKRAAESGASVMATLVSTPRGVLERLTDFDDKTQWGAPHLVHGWAACRLLPRLCLHCSSKHPSGERTRGPGCPLCRMLGTSGRQLVLDLWEVDQGQPRRLFSQVDQALDLVHRGLVARKDAEDALGPLEAGVRMDG